MAVDARQEEVMATRQDAADELAILLKKVADGLGNNGPRARRVGYGPSRAGSFGRRRSPKGFLLHSAGQRLQMLLPDGRLWQYHERRNIEGIYYDARVDHARAMHGTIPLGGGRFSYLGAVVGKYHFGYLETDDTAASPKGYELGAIVGQDAGAPQYMAADAAFDHILRSL